MTALDSCLTTEKSKLEEEEFYDRASAADQHHLFHDKVINTNIKTNFAIGLYDILTFLWPAGKFNSSAHSEDTLILNAVAQMKSFKPYS